MDLKIWFLIAAGLLSLGVPFAIIGSELPSTMNSAILFESAEYAILDEEDHDFWAIIPGRTEMTNIKSYYIYNCTNPEEVALRGKEPVFVEVGPFNYLYTHKLENRNYVSEDGEENSRVYYNKNFTHTYIGDPKDLLKEYRVINLAGMKRWSNIKSKERFQIAIEGFFETFTYSKVNFIRDLAISDVIKHFNINNINELLRGLLDISSKTQVAISADFYYGLLQKENVYEWTLMCDTKNSYIEHELMTYFGFSLSSFVKVKDRFCEVYSDIHKKVHDKICKNIPYCTSYNVSYQQWMFANVVTSYANVTYKKLFGIYEFANYTTQFFKMIKPEYEQQFRKVDWKKKSYHYLLDTHHDHPNTPTNRASLLLYNNMRRLYTAGIHTQNPFKDSKEGVSGELDLLRFEEVAKDLDVTKEQAFMLYSYFEYYINNTILLQEYEGDLVKERVGNYGAAVLKDISEYYRDFLDVLIYTRALITRSKAKKCEEIVVEYFTMKETRDIMNKLKPVLCNKFNISTAIGWKYFVEASSYPYNYHYKELDSYFKNSIKEFTSNILEEMIYGTSSHFYKVLDSIKKDVKKHYETVTGKKACENECSLYCTKRQLFLTQFYQSAITLHPFPDSHLPATSYIADWWTLIDPYIEKNEFPMYTELPDRAIEVPIEIPYLHENYGEVTFTKRDLFKCFTFIQLYDTDSLYYLLLKIVKGEKPSFCPMFASNFFHNSLRYFIRNVHFGPMFSRIHPNDVFFGYKDTILAAEHHILDYLEGDDCTVNPYIGYNPINSKLNESTFDYLSLEHKVHTGMKTNNNLRKYDRYYGNSNFFYRKLIRDLDGDSCTFISDSAFKVSIAANIATDGLQFPQHDGKTRANHTKTLFDSNVFRPVEIVRKTDREYNYYDLEVDTYVVDFESDYLSPDGVNVKNGIDMTSFFQYGAIATQARLEGIQDYTLNLPNITYTHPLDDEPTPLDLKNTESYYVIEPYTGITMQYVKKYMFSLVIYYDDLYQPPIQNNLGEIVPSYSMYEKANVSSRFAYSISEDIGVTQTIRHTIAITLSVIGILCSFSGAAMIIRACCLEPVEVPELKKKYLPDIDEDEIDWPDALSEDSKKDN